MDPITVAEFAELVKAELAASFSRPRSKEMWWLELEMYASKKYNEEVRKNKELKS